MTRSARFTKGIVYSIIAAMIVVLSAGLLTYFSSSAISSVKNENEETDTEHPILEDKEQELVFEIDLSEPILRDDERWMELLKLFFDEGTYDLDIDGETTTEELLEIIHHMSHQKIRADEKWGHIPMTRHTIDQLYEAVYANENRQSSGLLKDIAEQWHSERWESVHHEHNAVWDMIDRSLGKIGRAKAQASPLEEWWYIHEHHLDMFTEIKNNQ